MINQLGASGFEPALPRSSPPRRPRRRRSSPPTSRYSPEARSVPEEDDGAAEGAILTQFSAQPSSVTVSSWGLNISTHSAPPSEPAGLAIDSLIFTCFQPG